MIVALLLLPLLAARAQEFLMVTDSAHLQHYIDSITRHYYGDFFALGGNVPVMPLYGNNNQYRTPIGEIHTADDTIDCVVEIFYGSSDKRTYKNIKGRALLEVRDRTFPMKIPLQRHYAHKDLKGRRKSIGSSLCRISVAPRRSTPGGKSRRWWQRLTTTR